LENELLDWFCAKRARKLIVTGEALWEKALHIRDRLMEMTDDQDEKSRLSKFRCGYSWVGAFKKNHSIRKQPINGMEDSFDPEMVIGAGSQYPPLNLMAHVAL
jgi:hypothetical protein